MLFEINFLLILKYAVCTAVLTGIVLAPAYLAGVNGKDKHAVLLIRAASWLLGWTVVGWLWALYYSVRK
jgi:hypothetical protein